MDDYTRGRIDGLREAARIADLYEGFEGARDEILSRVGEDAPPALCHPVKVKPLEWHCTDWSAADGVKGENDCEWTAEVWPLTNYIISWRGGDRFEIRTPLDERLTATSLVEAKAAAYADKVHHVLADLEPTPAPSVSEAARVLLDALVRAQISSSTLRLFYDGKPHSAFRAIAQKEAT